MRASGGQTGFEMTGWASDTWLRGLTASGPGASRGLAVTVGAWLGGTVSETMSVDVPVVVWTISVNSFKSSNVSFSNSLSASYALIGSGFFVSASIFLGDTSSILSSWLSDTCILCMSVSGVARSIGITVTAGAISSSTSSAISFEQPKIAFFAGLNQSFAVSLSSNIDRGLGSFEFSPAFHIGFSNSESTIWTSDSALTGKCASGIGQNLQTTITSGVSTSTSFEMFNYTIQEIVSDAAALASGSDLDIFPIQGFWCALQNEKCLCDGIVLFSNYGNSFSSAVAAESKGGLVCMPNQFGLNESIVGIYSCYCFNRPFIAGQMLTLTGNGFGTFDMSPAVSVSSSLAVSTMWLSQSSLVCKIPTCTNCGLLTPQSIVISIAQQQSMTSNISIQFSYNVSNEGLCPNFWLGVGVFRLNYISGLICRISSGVNESITWVIDPCNGTMLCDVIEDGFLTLETFSVPTRSLLQTSLEFSSFDTGKQSQLNIFSCTEDSCSLPWTRFSTNGSSYLPQSIHGNPYLQISWAVDNNQNKEQSTWIATWTSSYNRTFAFFNESLTYSAAFKACVDINDGARWHLASIASSLERSALNFLQSGDAWIGFRKEPMIPREFRWADQSPTEPLECKLGMCPTAVPLPDDSDLEAYYTFSAETFLNDSSGFGRTLKPFGFVPTLSLSNCLWGSACALFNLSDSSLEGQSHGGSFAIDPLNLGSWQNLTVCLWFLVYANEYPKNTLFQFGFNEEFDLFLGNLAGSKNLSLIFQTSLVQYKFVLNVEDAYVPEQWTHVCITSTNENHWAVHINGSEEVSGESDQVLTNYVNTNSNFIGWSADNSSVFTGLMENFRIYSRALSNVEIFYLSKWRGGDCGSISFLRNDTWLDADCSTSKPYICSRK